jgi:RNA polymerase sigma-70 factor (ECF subfamily)
VIAREHSGHYQAVRSSLSLGKLSLPPLATVAAPVASGASDREANGASAVGHDAVSSLALAPRLRALVDAHYSSIWRLLRRLGVPESQLDDAAQEVFWVATRRLVDVRSGSEHAFLYGIALRVASEERRRQQRRPELAGGEALVDIADTRPSAEEQLDQRRARELLDDVLDAMPYELRMVFVLFELEGLEAREIAEVIGTPVGTVSSRLRRARDEFSALSRRMRARLAFDGGVR